MIIVFIRGGLNLHRSWHAANSCDVNDICAIHSRIDDDGMVTHVRFVFFIWKST